MALPPVNKPVLIRRCSGGGDIRLVTVVGWRITQDGTMHGKARRLSLFQAPGLPQAALLCEWCDCLNDGFHGQNSAEFCRLDNVREVAHA